MTRLSQATFRSSREGDTDHAVQKTKTSEWYKVMKNNSRRKISVSFWFPQLVCLLELINAKLLWNYKKKKVLVLNFDFSHYIWGETSPFTCTEALCWIFCTCCPAGVGIALHGKHRAEGRQETVPCTQRTNILTWNRTPGHNLYVSLIFIFLDLGNSFFYNFGFGDAHSLTSPLASR